MPPKKLQKVNFDENHNPENRNGKLACDENRRKLSDELTNRMRHLMEKDIHARHNRGKSSMSESLGDEVRSNPQINKPSIQQLVRMLLDGELSLDCEGNQRDTASNSLEDYINLVSAVMGKDGEQFIRTCDSVFAEDQHSIVDGKQMISSVLFYALSLIPFLKEPGKPETAVWCCDIDPVQNPDAMTEWLKQRNPHWAQFTAYKKDGKKLYMSIKDYLSSKREEINSMKSDEADARVYRLIATFQTMVRDQGDLKVLNSPKTMHKVETRVRSSRSAALTPSPVHYLDRIVVPIRVRKSPVSVKMAVYEQVLKDINHQAPSPAEITYILEGEKDICQVSRECALQFQNVIASNADIAESKPVLSTFSNERMTCEFAFLRVLIHLASEETSVPFRVPESELVLRVIDALKTCDSPLAPDVSPLDENRCLKSSVREKMEAAIGSISTCALQTRRLLNTENRAVPRLGDEGWQLVAMIILMSDLKDVKARAQVAYFTSVRMIYKVNGLTFSRSNAKVKALLDEKSETKSGMERALLLVSADTKLRLNSRSQEPKFLDGEELSMQQVYDMLAHVSGLSKEELDRLVSDNKRPSVRAKAAAALAPPPPATEAAAAGPSTSKSKSVPRKLVGFKKKRDEAGPSDKGKAPAEKKGKTRKDEEEAPEKKKPRVSFAELPDFNDSSDDEDDEPQFAAYKLSQNRGLPDTDED